MSKATSPFQISHSSLSAVEEFEEGFFNNSHTYVHPTAIIGRKVTIGINVKIGPSCVVVGTVSIGEGTRLYPNVTIGFPAQVREITSSLGSIVIGKSCEIREFVTIHAAKKSTGTTSIGNHCYIMNFCHIAHDVILENNVTLTNNVNLGGHVFVGEGANLMANTASHQFCRIGRLVALTPFSGTRQDLPPFCMFTGQPSQFSGINKVGLKRANFSAIDIDALKQVTRLFYQEKLLLNEIKVRAANKATSWGSNKIVQEFITFIASSKRGVSRRCLDYGKKLFYQQ